MSAPLEAEERTAFATWRLILYGIAALIVSGVISRYQHDRGILIGASVGIPIVIAAILLFYRASRSVFVQRRAWLLVCIYIAAQIALAIWDRVEK